MPAFHLATPQQPRGTTSNNNDQYFTFYGRTCSPSNKESVCLSRIPSLIIHTPPPPQMIISTITFATICFCAVEAANQTSTPPKYDYIIVGGGTSGLVVANRLSELKDITVAVIEAGDSVYNNINVTNVEGYGRAFGTKIDWAYQTEDQKYAGGGKQTMRAGKAIGGTSTINGSLHLSWLEWKRGLWANSSLSRNVIYPSAGRTN